MIQYSDNTLIIKIYGVLFTSIEELVALYRRNDETFMRYLRGSYWGELYDKKKQIKLVWNDHVGDKIIFYADSHSGLKYHSSLSELANIIRKERPLQYNAQFMWSLLIYGYSPICHTIYEGIQRIPAGKYIKVDKDNQWELKTYHRFTNQPNHLTLEENIVQYDALFRQAIKRALDINEMNKKHHYMPLSAGLDSRMSCRVAHDMTNQPITNITYSQTGYYDEVIPHELASYWGNEWHFKALDRGDYLMNLDDISLRTFGLVNYTGAAQVADSFDELDSSTLGIVITGMLGDIVANAHYSPHDTYTPFTIGEGAYVNRYIDQIHSLFKHNIESMNKEIGYLYIRGFNGANLGSPIIQQEKGESYSPFYDVDVLEFALSIPAEQRMNYKFYDSWICSCYPDMTQWLHNGKEQIGHRPIYISIMGRTMPIKDVPKRIWWFALKKMHLKDKYTLDISKSMNPEDDWIKNNPKLSDYVQSYVAKNINLIPFKEIRNAAETLNKGTFMERSQVLSLLAAIRNFPV